MSAQLQSDPLFSSAQPALLHAFRFSSEEYRQSAVSKMARSPSRGGNPSLAGLDGAGQAGMIRSMLSNNLSTIHLAILTARTAPRTMPCPCRRACCKGSTFNQEWEGAISILVEASEAEFDGLKSKRELRAMLIRQHFGERSDAIRTVRDVAKRTRSDIGTVSDYKGKIKRWLYGDSPAKVKVNARRGEEIRAWAEAEAILFEAGIVG